MPVYRTRANAFISFRIKELALVRFFDFMAVTWKRIGKPPTVRPE